MREEELNSLIVSFQSGNESALDEICKEFLPTLTKVSEKIWYKLKNNTNFECRCLIKLRRALMNFDAAKGKAESLILNVITKERSDFINGKRGRFREVISIESLSQDDEKGNIIPYEVEDESFSIEDDIVEKISIQEKITLLAQGDIRKKLILDAWTNGVTNDLELSRMLAHSTGGNVESHRKYIQRFRKTCQMNLAGII